MQCLAILPCSYIAEVLYLREQVRIQHRTGFRDISVAEDKVMCFGCEYSIKGYQYWSEVSTEPIHCTPTPGVTVIILHYVVIKVYS